MGVEATTREVRIVVDRDVEVFTCDNCGKERIHAPEGELEGIDGEDVTESPFDDDWLEVQVDLVVVSGDGTSFKLDGIFCSGCCLKSACEDQSGL